MDEKLMEERSYQLSQVRRDTHPALTIFWIAESLERGRPVEMLGLSCIFCKKTLGTDFKGSIAMIVNAPVSLIDYGLALTVRCRQCKQNYRLVVADSFLG